MSSWDGVAEAYRTSFATLCEGTIETLLADTSGGVHLDVGSGTGDLAARAVARGRTVVAVDADPGMVALSASLVPGSVVGAALPRLPFGDNAFDTVTANFVVNHVDDPRAAMCELGRVTRRGGRVATTAWTSAVPAWASLVSAAFDAAGVVPVPRPRLSPELDFERSVDGLGRLAAAAGMSTVRATELTWQWRISLDALWGGVAGGVATAGQTLLAQAPEVQVAAEQRFRELARDRAPDGMLTLDSTAAYVVAAV